LYEFFFFQGLSFVYFQEFVMKFFTSSFRSIHFSFFILFAVFFTFSFAAPTVVVAITINSISQATVPIVGISVSGKSFKTFGTGFVFQWKRRIITTATIVDSVSAKYLIPESRLGVLITNGSKKIAASSQFHAVKVTYIDRIRNIALLTADSDLSVIPLQRVSKKIVKAGDMLSVTGWTGSGLVPTYFEGAVSFITKGNSNSQPYLGLAFPVGIGATGGPVFNLKTGDLQGVVQLKTRFVAREIYPGDGAIGESFGSAIVIPVKSLLEVLEQYKK
jgi:hypothetical protein